MKSVVLFVLCGLVGGDAEPPPKKTYVYKEVDSVKIHLDIYRPDDKRVRPVVVWIHGGALILGGRQGVPGDLRSLCRDEGYALVSIDYRLAPEVKVPAIIEDVRDAFRWLRAEGPRLAHLDPEMIVVAGGSAGGYLTMMTGICVKPKPTALVAYWGYGDIDGDWYTKPSPYYLRALPRIRAEDVESAVGKRVLTHVDSRTPFRRERGRYYQYLRQNGLWTKIVSGFDPESERLSAYCPVRNISPEYPPILMVHGTEDNDVPYSKSTDMAKELARHKVPHELVTVPDAGHGLAGGDKKVVAKARAKALAFIREHLGERS